MNIFVFVRSLQMRDRAIIRVASLLLALSLSGSLMAQLPNPDATLMFSRSAISGTARSVGAGGAFSSVGADLSALELNPAGLGLYQSTDLCLTPGLRVAADQSAYNGSTQSTNHAILGFAQGGAAFTKRIKDPKRALRFMTFAINFEKEASFDRSQNFGGLNTSQSLANKYAYYSSQAGTSQWAIEPYLLNLAGIISQDGLGTFSSNAKAPVQQAGSINTSGAINKISLGFGANIDDKLYLGFSLGIPILNYSVNTQMSETNANPNDTVTHFQYYQLNSNQSETGVGVTGKIGLIYKPAPWVRFGATYTLPTWYFLTENANSDLQYSFDTIPATEIGPGSLPAFNYQLRTPMKGTLGASFYLQEHGFLSVDYDFQNIGSTHYSHFSDPSYAGIDTLFNNYMKTTYGYSHTIRVGLEGAIKKLRLRAGYSYTTSPFKKNQNYADAGYTSAVQTASVGLGLRFKVVYFDLAYALGYTKDGLSPNAQMPLDPINSRLITHNLLLTLGFKIGSSKSSPSQTKKRSSDELPRYIDGGDKNQKY
jgi:hypothetical protein